MTNFVICDQGLIEANSVPTECLGAPGSCPPGLYHTFFRHDGYVGLLELRVRYFSEQLRVMDHEPAAFRDSLFNAALLQDLLEKENLLEAPARVRMMVFDNPVKLTNGRSTECLAIAQPATVASAEPQPFRCAVAPRRRLERIDTWELKRLGRRQADEDLAAARARGYDDVLYLDRMGQWCEASYSNIVAIFGNRVCIIAPPDLAYKGLTSGILSALKKELKPLQIHNASIGQNEIKDADEVFLTSSVRGLQPITEIEGVGTWPLEGENSVRKRIYEIMRDSGII